MADGQLAINTAAASPGLFFKDAGGTLVKVGPVHVGTTAPNATPASGGQAGNSIGEQWLDTAGGRFVFKIWDGTAWRTEDGEFVNASGDVMTGAFGIIAGSATAPGLYFSGDTNTGIYSPGADQVAISTNGTGRLFVNASGNVGIGTTSPQSTLVLRGSTPRLTLEPTADTQNTRIQFATTNGETRSAIYGGGTLGADLTFTNVPTIGGTGTERMRLDSSGRLGLGTSIPGFPLHLVTSGNSGAAVYAGTSGANQIYLGNTAGESVVGTLSNHNFGIVTNGGQKVTVTTGGAVGIGTTSPAWALSVNGSTGGANYIQITNSDTGSAVGDGSLVGLDQDENLILWSQENTAVRFGSNNLERARIDSSGRLLVGTSTVALSAGFNEAKALTVIKNTDAAKGQLNLAAGTTVPSGAGGTSVGAAQVIHWVNNVTASGSCTKLIIPFISQASLNQNTLVKLLAKESTHNTATTNRNFEATFTVGHLNSLSNLASWNTGGNFASIATSGMNVEITLTNAIASGSILTVYLQVMCYQTERSVDFSSIALAA
jgi:hypothetical protein